MASGEIATSPEAAERAAEAGRTVVLVRAETSPDDVHGMSLSAGILTARGGLASHAAVVARGWGIPAVVGASGIEVRDGEVVIGGRTFRDGDTITIDGASGEVFEGEIPGRTEPVPQARTLLAWAAELGVPIGAGDEPQPSAAPAATPAPARGDARQLHPAARDEGLRDDPGARGFAPHARRKPSSRCSTSWSSTASRRRSRARTGSRRRARVAPRSWRRPTATRGASSRRRRPWTRSSSSTIG